MTDQTLTIDVPDSAWLTSNRKEHPQVVARKRRVLRQLAWAKTKQARLRPYSGPVHVMAWIQYRTGGRADPCNAYPSIKSLIDGLVDAGLITDDDSEHVIGPDMRRTPGKAPADCHRIKLTFTEQEVPF